MTCVKRPTTQTDRAQGSPASRRRRWWSLAAWLVAGGTLTSAGGTLTSAALTACESSSDSTAFDAGRATFALPGLGGAGALTELRYSDRAQRLLVPAAKWGELLLVDGRSGAIEKIGGFSRPLTGATSDVAPELALDEFDRFLFVADAFGRRISVVDWTTKAIIASSMLAGTPNEVRYVPDTHELWVAEAGGARIELVEFIAGTVPTLRHSGFVATDQPVRALAVDTRRGLVYAHLGDAVTVAFSAVDRTIQASFSHGCQIPGELIVESTRGIVFVVCGDGKVAVRAGTDGLEEIAVLQVASSAGQAAYNENIGHLYVPDPAKGEVVIVDVIGDGQLAIIDRVPTATQARCAAADRASTFFVCDPTESRVMRFFDAFRDR